VAKADEQTRKVLLVAPRMEPRGTSEYTVNLARGLKRQGAEVLVLCVAGPPLEAIRRDDIRVETFARLESPLFPFTEQKRFAQVVAQFAPQIVHLQSVRVSRVAGALRKGCAAPVVLTVHWRPGRRRWFQRLSRKVSGIIATTQAVREEIVNQCRVEKNKIVVIPNGIDVERIDATAVRPIFSGHTPVVGSVGPVERGRGHELFVQAAARLVGRGCTSQFVVAGEGPELPSLRELAASLGLQGCLTFATQFSEYEEILDAFDVVVQSSLVDVSGFSILEAMGRGRPVIAFNTGTACEMIEDNKTGRLVQKGNVSELADAIEELTKNVEKAREMGGRARQRVRERFDVRRIARQTLEFYNGLLPA